MACVIRDCYRKRPGNFKEKIQEFSDKIFFYRNRINDLNHLKSDLKIQVSDKIDSCVTPNLEISLSNSDMRGVLDSVNKVRNDISYELSNIDSLITDYNNELSRTKENMKSYLNEAWVEICPCVEANYE